MRGALAEELPRFVKPALLRAAALPDGDRWAYQVKWDGCRGQLRWDGRRAVLRSRPGRDCTAEFPELAAGAALLGSRRVLLDGEIVSFADDGKPDFDRVRRRMAAAA